MIRKKTLAELQAESRERQMRLKEQARTKKKEQREQDSKRKKEMQKHLQKLNDDERVKKERLQDKELRIVDDSSRWIGTRDDYYTLEELLNPPEGEKGRINWFKFNELVMKGKENATKTIK